MYPRNSKKRLGDGQMYIKPDGNGGVNISKSMIAFISLIITVIVVLSGVVYANAILREQVNTNIRDIEDIKNTCARMDLVDAKLSAIQEEIKEIKEILKEK